MTTERNVWNRFETLGTDPQDVFIALRTIAGDSTVQNGRRISLGDPPRFRVGSTNSGKPLINLLDTRDTQALDAIVAECGDLMTGQRRWTTVPMMGHFANQFASFVHPNLQLREPDQILVSPLTSVPPINSFGAGDQPPPLNALLLDVAFEGSRDWRLDIVRRDRAARSGGNIISLCTWPPLLPATGATGINSSQEVWALAWDNSSGTVRNARVHLGFSHPELGVTDCAPAVRISTRHFPSISHEHFAAGPVDLPTGKLHICESLPTILTNYLGMSAPQRQRADRSLTALTMARQARDASSVITASVTAIEALLEIEPSKCRCCGQNKFSISTEFSNFLDKFAGSAMRREFQKSIYPVRSKIIHGSGLAEADSHWLGVDHEYTSDQLKAWGSARAALLNWLLTQTTQPES